MMKLLITTISNGMNLFSAKIAYASVDTFLANVNREIINPLIKFLFALAVVYFLWGLIDFFLHPENEEKRTEGKSHMIWGIVGITIMMGVWTWTRIALNTLHIEGIDPEKGTVQLGP